MQTKKGNEHTDPIGRRYQKTPRIPRISYRHALMEGTVFKIKVDGLKEILENVDDLIKHRIPKMTAMAVTATAKSLKEATEKQLAVVFDRPNRWTLGSVYYRPASISDMNAYVWFKDDSAVGKGTPASKYLWAQIHGGPRRFKRYEVALQRFGVLPPGYYTVPGAGIKLDSHGNIPTGTITEILTGVGALTGMSDTEFYGKLGGYKKKKKTTANFFVVKKKHGGLVPGIWERSPETGKEFKTCSPGNRACSSTQGRLLVFG